MDNRQIFNIDLPNGGLLPPQGGIESNQLVEG